MYYILSQHDNKNRHSYNKYLVSSYTTVNYDIYTTRVMVMKKWEKEVGYRKQ